MCVEKEKEKVFFFFFFGGGGGVVKFAKKLKILLHLAMIFASKKYEKNNLYIK